jgi:hypothetical protein
MKITYISRADQKRRIKQSKTARDSLFERRLYGIRSVEVEADMGTGQLIRVEFPTVSLAGVLEEGRLSFKADQDFSSVGEIAFIN